MAIIYNLKELNGLGRDLKEWDWIYFTTKDKVIKYKVIGHMSGGCFLNYYDNYNNAIIFNYLDLNMNDRYQLAKKYYRYTAIDVLSVNSWPECKFNDFPALERLIREIYKRLGDNSTEILDPKNMITSRFEILDL